MSINRKRQLGGRCAPLLRLALALAAIYALWLAQAWRPARADAWAACSVASYHFDRSKGYNERNWGCGLEYGIAQDARLVAGGYRNSLARTSVYAGALWTPLHLGPARAGVVGGVVNGYGANEGRFLPIVVPALALEHRGIGINLLAAPRYRDSPGVLGFQLKLQID
jgi:hypothetical protein